MSYRELRCSLRDGSGWIKERIASFDLKMNEDTLRRWVRQVQSRGPPSGPSPAGFFAGGGLALLILGGIAINASLFTGTLKRLLLLNIA